MKQLLLLLFTLLCSFPLFAQLRLGVQGGFSMAKFLPVEMRRSSLPPPHKTAWFRGGQIGLVAESRISKAINIRSGLFLNGKGTVLFTQTSMDTGKRNIELHYIELPLVFTYKKNISKTCFAYAGAGVYLAKAVRGIEKGNVSRFSGTYGIENYIIFSNENPNRLHPTVIKPFDWGYTTVAGVERKRLQLSINYSLSGSVILPNTNTYKANYKNSVATLSLAYFIVTK